MKIEIKKFGEILVSKPDGLEAFNIIKSYLKPTVNDNSIELDFTGVNVMAPSWLDEVYRGIKDELGKKVVFLDSKNASVVESVDSEIEGPGKTLKAAVWLLCCR